MYSIEYSSVGIWQSFVMIRLGLCVLGRTTELKCPYSITSKLHAIIMTYHWLTLIIRLEFVFVKFLLCKTFFPSLSIL